VALFFLLLLVGAVLTVFLWAGTLFFQGYIYTEPVEQVSWRAPAAAAALTVFFALWCLLDANTRGSSPQDLPYNSIFRFSPREALTPGPVKKLWVVRKGSKAPEEYQLQKYAQAGQTRYEYVQVGSKKAWTSVGVEAILLEEDGEKVAFKPRQGPEGGYREFVDANGWAMPEYDTGPTGQPTKFRFGLFLANIFLNLLHLGLWFACLWLLLRFQWTHALGLALVLWLVATLVIVEPLLTEAGKLAWATPPPRGSAAVSFHTPIV
jgi:hypothetical protein